MSGRRLLEDPTLNRDNGFTAEEREAMNIDGLVAPRVQTLAQQSARIHAFVQSLPNRFEQFLYLRSVYDRNETLFYRVLLDDIKNMLPVIYTPTVGEVCTRYSDIYIANRGVYLHLGHKGKIEAVLRNWDRPVDIIVVTDGSRILGLGDLGANGMGIPVGKLCLYVAAGGLHPTRTLPITIDLGTDKRNRENPHYIGVDMDRVSSEEYHAFWAEFMAAVPRVWPKCVVQFEDIATPHCFDLLKEYQFKNRCFNDDIQGTGAIVLSGFINFIRACSIDPREIRVVFLGAGSAGVGVASQMVDYLVTRGLTTEEAHRVFYMVDTKGLILANRPTMESFKRPFARTDFTTPIEGLREIIQAAKPHALIGLAGHAAGSFNQTIIEELVKVSPCKTPLIGALSNPTSVSECSAQDAINFTQGKCWFISGSPYPTVHYNGREINTGQANNMYIFPALGLAASLCQARHITNAMILSSAIACASCATDADFASGSLYPSPSSIRDVSAVVAAAVIDTAIENGVAENTKKWSKQDCLDAMYKPTYSRL